MAKRTSKNLIANPPTGLQIETGKSVSRVTRSPNIPFYVRHRAFDITPFMVHPILTGESLTNILWQSRAVTKPVTSPLIGWWMEYYFFYVPLRALDKKAGDKAYENMLLDFNEEVADTATANTATFHPANAGHDYLTKAYDLIVEKYFRDEGEAALDFHIDNIPLCQVYGRGRSDVFDKLTLAADYEDHRVKLDADDDGEIYVGDEMQRAFNEWAAAHDAGLVDMTYEDWMRTYGGRSDAGTEPDRVDFHRPEDIAYVREFTYPTNTVEPSTGVPAVAVGWRVASNLRKSFRFTEPGWILVTQTVRPKVYMGNQQGLVASMMQTRDTWLPAVLNAESTVGHLAIPETAGPLAAVMAESYMLSIRDLLLYGEQFVNYAPAGLPGFMALPTAAAVRRYAGAAEVMGMFADEVNGRFRADGMISLNILGRQRETTNNLTLFKA